MIFPVVFFGGSWWSLGGASPFIHSCFFSCCWCFEMTFCCFLAVLSCLHLLFLLFFACGGPVSPLNIRSIQNQHLVHLLVSVASVHAKYVTFLQRSLPPCINSPKCLAYIFCFWPHFGFFMIKIMLQYTKTSSLETTPNREQQYIEEHQFSDGPIFQPSNQFSQLTVAGSLQRKIVTGKTFWQIFPERFNILSRSGNFFADFSKFSRISSVLFWVYIFSTVLKPPSECLIFHIFFRKTN